MWFIFSAVTRSVQDRSRIICRSNMGTNSNERNTTDCSSPLSCLGTSTLVAEVFALIVILILSSLGNIIILVVVKRSRRSEWTTNYFVTSLAISNLMPPFLSVLWTAVWILKGAWFLGNVTCKVTFFVHFLNAGVSLGLLACISMDRFYVIVHPLKLKMTRVQTRELITFVWVFVLCASAPSLFFFKTTTESRDLCLIEFHHTVEKVVYLAFFAVALCLPSFFTCVVYIRVSIAVVRRNRQARQFQNDYRRLAFKVPTSKVKVMRMFIIQWFVFIACCFPFFVTLAVKTLDATQISVSLYVNLLIWSFSNAGSNVVIYAIFNGDFRRGCQRMFCKRDSSQAYRLTTLGRKNRIVPSELSSGDHGEGFDFRLTDRENEKGNQNRGKLVIKNTHRLTDVWVSSDEPRSSVETSRRTVVSEISKA